MKFSIWIVAFAFSLIAAGAANSETLNNASVIMLSKAGLGTDTIVAKIRNSPNSFDTSTEQLVKLKQEGVSDQIIAAMLNASNGSVVSSNANVSSDTLDPLAPHASGVYVAAQWEASPKMVHLDASTSAQSTSSGTLAYAFTYGIAKVRSKAVLNTPSARIHIPMSKPVFYFYFDESGSNLSQGVSLWSAFAGQNKVTSPSEFTLIKLETKKNSRDFETGSFNIAGSSSGVNEKQRIAFTYDFIAPGVYKVTPVADLPLGEYGFTYSAGAGSSIYGVQLVAPKIFDFAIVQP